MEKFRNIVKEFTNYVCWVRRVGEQRKEGSGWWSDKAGMEWNERAIPIEEVREAVNEIKSVKGCRSG